MVDTEYDEIIVKDSKVKGYSLHTCAPIEPVRLSSAILRMGEIYREIYEREIRPRERARGEEVAKTLIGIRIALDRR